MYSGIEGAHFIDVGTGHRSNAWTETTHPNGYIINDAESNPESNMVWMLTSFKSRDGTRSVSVGHELTADEAEELALHLLIRVKRIRDGPHRVTAEKVYPERHYLSSTEGDRVVVNRSTVNGDVRVWINIVDSDDMGKGASLNVDQAGEVALAILIRVKEIRDGQYT